MNLLKVKKLVEVNLLSHRTVRAVQAHVGHVFAAAIIKKSKGLSKYHTMMPQIGGGGEQSVTSIARHGL